jgi:hypothetical protein
MIAIFITFGTATLLIYLYVSLRERTYINALTPFFAFYFATSFVFEPFYFDHATNYQYDVQAFTFVYCCDFAYFVGLAVTYLAVIRGGQTANGAHPLVSPQSDLRWLAWLFLIASTVIFLPVALEFREYVFSNPRQLYAQTRSGYGQYLFVSALLTNLAVICFLFSSKKGGLLFIPCVILLSLLKGAKTSALIVVEIYAMWAIYCRGWRVGLVKFLASMTAFAVIIAGLFAFTFQGIDPADLFAAISGYSDYNRNASLTVTQPMGPYYGTLAVENFAYSRIPRAVVPDKPKNFGAFRIAEHYFPETFALGSGSPAFGAGVYIADFGALTPLVMLLFGLFSGYFLGLCIQWLRRGGGIAAFITMLYLANVSLIPIPMGFLGIEHWMLGLLVAKMARLRLRFWIPVRREISARVDASVR